MYVAGLLALYLGMVVATATLLLWRTRRLPRSRMLTTLWFSIAAFCWPVTLPVLATEWLADYAHARLIQRDERELARLDDLERQLNKGRRQK